MPAVLRSRIPEIALELPVAVGAAVHSGTEAMATSAASGAPVDKGELRDSIEARSGESKSTGQEAYGIWAAWYWFFSEFGTIHEAARPFMIPAVEAGKEPLLAEVRAVLGQL